MTEARPPKIVLTLANRQSFLDVFTDKEGGAEVFIAGHTEFSTGTVVSLELIFIRELITFDLRGVVRWRRVTASGRLPAGLGVELLASEEEAHELVVQFARGSNVAVRRRPRRVPVTMDVEYSLDTGFVHGTLHDLSRDGAFVLTNDPPPSRTLLALRIYPRPGSRPLTLNGEVAWRRDQAPRGFGVTFLVGDATKQAELDRLIAVHAVIGDRG
ncbi:MAG: PilZ domain-containing protein, partial [Myxococcota bacterium]